MVVPTLTMRKKDAVSPWRNSMSPLEKERSVIKACHDCRVTVFIFPSRQRLWQAHRAQPVCRGAGSVFMGGAGQEGRGCKACTITGLSGRSKARWPLRLPK